MICKSHVHELTQYIANIYSRFIKTIVVEVGGTDIYNAKHISNIETQIKINGWSMHQNQDPYLTNFLSSRKHSTNTNPHCQDL